MAVSDLTNTIWLINEEIIPDSEYSIGASINFVSNGTNYNLFTVEATEDFLMGEGYSMSIMYAGNDSQDYPYYYFSGISGWENEGWRTIVITGGDDVQNADLIAWLEANAIQQGGDEYYISKSITNGTISGSNTIAPEGTETLTLTPNTHYNLPSTISVSGASYTYNSSTGVIVLTNPTGMVSIEATCTPDVYTITYSVSNGTYNGSQTINYGETKTITITPSTGYYCPQTISVSGAELVGYNKITGIFKIKNATSNVSITVICTTTNTQDGFLFYQNPQYGSLRLMANKYWDGTIQYSFDNSTWVTWTGGFISSSAGVIYLRGTNNTQLSKRNITTSSSDSYRIFSLSGYQIQCSGNIENLLDYQTVANGGHPQMAEYAFYDLFYNQTYLISAPELGATTLTDYCYSGMFYKCSGLKYAPKLPATTFARNCYDDMFGKCTNLETIPALYGLNYDFYYICGSMFYGCSKIKLSTTQDSTYTNAYRIPRLGTGAQTNAYAFTNMFYQTSGSFTGTPEINTTYYTSNEIVLVDEYEPTPSTTNNLFFGNSTIDKIYFGTSEVSKIYYGNTLIYEAGGDIPDNAILDCNGNVIKASDGYLITSELEETNYLTFESDDGSEFTLGTNANDYGTVWSYVFGSDGTFEYSTDKVTWNSWTPTTQLQSVNGKLYLRGLNNTYLSVWSSCFLPGTEITLADGTKKKIEDITYNDRLKVWNFDTGEFDTADICWLTRPKLKNYHYYKLTFSDGTILKTTGQKSNHKVYNVDERYFKGVNVTEVGDRIFTENGIVTVVSKEYIEEEVLYYNLITSLNFCCFANGILTSDRYGNIYPIDENMMFIKGDRPIRPYDEYEEVGISRYWYDNLRLGENTETIEETKKYIDRLESQMRERE